MSTFLQDSCYESANAYSTCVEFHFDEHQRKGFNTSHLITYSLDPNPEAKEDKNAPPQQLHLIFSTADVIILGWRLGFLADRLRENKLAAVGILPKRYAELERATLFVSSISITPIGKD